MKHPAIIDIGSNSVRLVIYEGLSRFTPILYNEKISCQLGDFDAQGCLKAAAKGALLRGLIKFKAVTKSLNGYFLKITATAALRDAADGEDFHKTIMEKTGLQAQIISGIQEADYAKKGLFYTQPNAIGTVADLGGGSLEITHTHHQHSASYPLGVLRLWPDFNNNQTMLLQDKIDHHVKTLPSSDILYLIGGSWRALARLYILETEYHLENISFFTIHASEILSFIQDKMDMAIFGGKKKYPSISKKRFTLMPVVGLILQAILQKGDYQKITFINTGIREGILYDHLPPAEQSKSPLLSYASAVQKKHSRHDSLPNKLYHSLLPLFSEKSTSHQVIISAFCKLSDIMWPIDRDYRAKMIFNYILYQNIPFIDHAQRLFLALSLAYRYEHDFHIDKKYSMCDVDDGEAKILGLAARYLYTQSNMSINILENLTLEISGDTRHLSIKSKGEFIEYPHSIKHRLRLEKALGKRYEF